MICVWFSGLNKPDFWTYIEWDTDTLAASQSKPDCNTWVSNRNVLHFLQGWMSVHFCDAFSWREMKSDMIESDWCIFVDSNTIKCPSAWIYFRIIAYHPWTHILRGGKPRTDLHFLNLKFWFWPNFCKNIQGWNSVRLLKNIQRGLDPQVQTVQNNKSSDTKAAWKCLMQAGIWNLRAKANLVFE